MTPSIHIPLSAKTKVIFWPLLFLQAYSNESLVGICLKEGLRELVPNGATYCVAHAPASKQSTAHWVEGARALKRGRVCTRLWPLDQFVFTRGQSGGSSGRGTAMRPLRRGLVFVCVFPL